MRTVTHPDESRHDRFTRQRRRHRRRGRDPARRPGCRDLLAQRDQRPLLDQRGRSGALGSGALLRPGSEGAREDVLEDRRLGPGLGVGSARLEAPGPAEGGRRDGRRPQVGGRVHADGADRRRLARSPAGPRSHRGDHRQRPVGREALPDGAADHVPRARARARARRELRRAARGRALDDRGRAARQPRGLAPGDHRGHDAGRARQLHRRPGRQPLQPPRAQLHHRRGLRVRAGGDGRDRRRAARARVRRRDHRRGRSQHGRPHVRQVLRDRRAVAERHAPVLGRRRRVRDGRGRGAVRRQAARRRRPRRRPDLRRGARRWAARATARARASPPRTRWGSASRSSGPGGTPGCRPRSARSWRATAPPPASATRSSWAA